MESEYKVIKLFSFVVHKKEECNSRGSIAIAFRILVSCKYGMLMYLSCVYSLDFSFYGNFSNCFYYFLFIIVKQNVYLSTVFV